MSPPKWTLYLSEPEPGRKTRHLILITHKGGGWYVAECMGSGKRCKAGTCKHVPVLRFGDSERPIKHVPRKVAA